MYFQKLFLKIFTYVIIALVFILRRNSPTKNVQFLHLCKLKKKKPLPVYGIFPTL
jgi:hypothetical protein